MHVSLYGLPNCSTVRAARAWLAEHDIAYEWHDFKKEGVSPPALAQWQQALGWEAVLNRRGTTWRSLSPEQRASAVDAASAATLLREHPSLIKRPILVRNDQVLAGFSEGAYRTVFATAHH